jgi:hypothetical protein
MAQNILTVQENDTVTAKCRLVGFLIEKVILTITVFTIRAEFLAVKPLPAAPLESLPSMAIASLLESKLYRPR